MVPNTISVITARQGCLDIQPAGNMTALVGKACNGKSNCSFQSPGEQPNSATRALCTQGMEITYGCANGSRQVATVPGDAWKHGPAELACQPAMFAKSSAPDPTLTMAPVDPEVTGKIKVISARQGCLDIQPAGNMTQVVAKACDGREFCEFKAPNGDQPGSKTRTFCTQQLEVTYQCGAGGAHTASTATFGTGDAWAKPPLPLNCSGPTMIAMNYGSADPTETKCSQTKLGPPAYYLPPSEMLDWTPTFSQGQYPLEGFRPPMPAVRAMYKTGVGTVTDFEPAPGVTPGPAPGIVPQAIKRVTPSMVMGANEGRLRSELREAAASKDPVNDLCLAAKRFTSNKPAAGTEPSDRDFGNAFADLAVTGRAAFAKFVALRPTEAMLQAASGCAGTSGAAKTAALDRAYAVAAALREAHDSAARKALGWVAVSGEDDQPYLPVNVPGTEGVGRGSFPLFHIPVTTHKITVNARYMIAHAKAPVFRRPAALVNVGPTRMVPAELVPAIAPDAEVILFVHGLDSKAEEALNLTDALHRLPGHNWTVISMDLPSSGYTDNIDSERVGPLDAVGCHSTAGLDYVEDFIVEFVNALDKQVDGQLKPRVRAVVGGSLGGNMAMRLGRRDDLKKLAGLTPDTPWINTVVPWSPASVWTSFVGRQSCAACGCDTGWDLFKDQAVQGNLIWAGRQSATLNRGIDGSRFLPKNETPELRRELFYGGFDWDLGEAVHIFSSDNHRAQAQCWFSDKYPCKQATIQGARLDRHETYDRYYRAWHWRLAAEQLAFSHQQNVTSGGSTDPLYLHNTKPMLLFSGTDDVCGALGKNTENIAKKMTNTPGYFRFLNSTGHSLDNEHPDYIATKITEYLNSRNGAMSTEVGTDRVGGDYSSFAAGTMESCRAICAGQEPCKAYTFVKGAGGAGTCWLKNTVPAGQANPGMTSGVKQ